VLCGVAGGCGVGVLISERSPAACEDTLIQFARLLVLAFPPVRHL
jgi:hypothetical protein